MAPAGRDAVSSLVRLRHRHLLHRLALPCPGLGHVLHRAGGGQQDAHRARQHHRVGRPRHTRRQGCPRVAPPPARAPSPLQPPARPRTPPIRPPPPPPARPAKVAAAVPLLGLAHLPRSPPPAPHCRPGSPALSAACVVRPPTVPRRCGAPSTSTSRRALQTPTTFVRPSRLPRPPATCLAAPRTPSHTAPSLTPRPRILASGAPSADVPCAAPHLIPGYCPPWGGGACPSQRLLTHTSPAARPIPPPSQELDSLDTRSKEADEKGRN